MKPDIGIHFIIAIFIWLVSWTAAIDLEHKDLNTPYKICGGLVFSCPTTDDNKDVVGKSSSRKCQCDEACDEYGDCCTNSPYFYKNTTHRNEKRFECVRVDGSLEDGVYVVNKCPAEWTDRRVRDACEAPADYRDGMLNNPVTSRATGHGYRNRFCALCNGDAVDPVLWDTRLVCENLLNVSEGAEQSVVDTLRYDGARWTVTYLGQVYRCEQTVVPPAGKSKLSIHRMFINTGHRYGLFESLDFKTSWAHDRENVHVNPTKAVRHSTRYASVEKTYLKNCLRFSVRRNYWELLCEPTYEYSGQRLSHCYDDEACKVYGDCCRNSKHYVETEQTVTAVTAGAVFNNSRYRCYKPESWTSAALLIDTCPRTSAAGLRDRCEQADVTTTYPVTGAADGHVYANAYCAWCRGVRHRVYYWKPLFRCSSKNGQRFSGRLEDMVNGKLLHRNGRWYYVNFKDLQLMSCGFQLDRPDAGPAPRPCVPSWTGYVDGCPAGTPAALARACASYTYTVFEKANVTSERVARVFRNVDCALCNGVPVNHTLCAPPRQRLRNSFNELFMVIPELCTQDEIYDRLAGKCRDVFRDELILATGAWCREMAAFGPDEYDVGSVDNETAYVYAYKSRVKYREDESRNGSTLYVCTEDAEGLRLREYAPPSYAKYLSYAGTVGSAASAVALVAHLALFARGSTVGGSSGGNGRPEPRNLPEKNLASLSGSLLLGYASYLAIWSGAVTAGPAWPCLASALVMHFGFLAAFAWMFVMSADVWFVLHAATKKLRVANGRRTARFVAYSAFAWLAPAALTALTGVLQLRLSATADAIMAGYRPRLEHNCWFRNPRSLAALFVLPAGVTVAANYVSFAGAVWLIATSGAGLDHRSSTTAVSRSRANLRVYVRLSLMMGLAWVFALIGAVTDSDVVWTINTALNSLQGAFIFLTFDCNWNATRVLAAFRRNVSTSDTATSTAGAPLSGSN
ncbi:uncharacterized protein LOC112691800 [Sipha flava]|uniref:Uncharacterized protein LOC112691800 n=2 Tax=Sipha flava TaxID=143950 RepID=A0A8B8GG89_9HEMI|nr:uncharacterized protein LOC112691800 [Sipha flava]